MVYEWDEEKRKANIAAHKIDFTDAARFDWNHAVIEIDRRGIVCARVHPQR
jgi:uncharacterized DUF497 family protein